MQLGKNSIKQNIPQQNINEQVILQASIFEPMLFNDFPNVISFQLGTYADDTNPVLVVSPTDPTK